MPRPPVRLPAKTAPRRILPQFCAPHSPHPPFTRSSPSLTRQYIMSDNYCQPNSSREGRPARPIFVQCRLPQPICPRPAAPLAHPDTAPMQQAGARHLCRITGRMLASLLFTKAVRLLKRPEGRAPRAVPTDPPDAPRAGFSPTFAFPPRLNRCKPVPAVRKRRESRKYQPDEKISFHLRPRGLFPGLDLALRARPVNSHLLSKSKF